MKKTYTVWEYIRSIIIFIIFILIIFFVGKYTSIQKTPATITQVKQVLLSLGYEVQDTTSNHSHETYNSGLVQSIGTQKGDINFEFFQFSNINDAVDAYGKFHSLIIRTRNSNIKSEYRTSRANFTTYKLRTRNLYSVSIYVGNTAVFATGSIENVGEIDKILSNIHYDLGLKIRLPDIAVRLFKILISILLMFMNLLSSRWLWSRVCKSANLTENKVKKFRKEKGSKFYINKATYSWLVENSSNSPKFKRLFAVYQIVMLPSRICILIAVISCVVTLLDSTVNGMMMVSVSTIVVMILAGMVEKSLFKKGRRKS